MPRPENGGISGRSPRDARQRRTKKQCNTLSTSSSAARWFPPGQAGTPFFLGCILAPARAELNGGWVCRLARKPLERKNDGSRRSRPTRRIRPEDWSPRVPARSRGRSRRRESRPKASDQACGCGHTSSIERAAGLAPLAVRNCREPRPCFPSGWNGPEKPASGRRRLNALGQHRGYSDFGRSLVDPYSISINYCAVQVDYTEWPDPHAQLDLPAILRPGMVGNHRELPDGR
jgi:hypothetical protein